VDGSGDEAKYDIIFKGGRFGILGRGRRWRGCGLGGGSGGDSDKVEDNVFGGGRSVGGQRG